MGWKSQQSLHPHLDVPGLAVAVVATMLRVSALRGMYTIDCSALRGMHHRLLVAPFFMLILCIYALCIILYA